MTLLLVSRKLRLSPHYMRPFYIPLVCTNRNTTFDQARERIGKREIVGYGWNGSPGYMDRLDYPMPPVRFQEPSPEMCSLREKEEGDWKKLTLDEKKMLYRYSFCQTFAEFKAPTSDWKVTLGAVFYIFAAAVLLSLSYHYFLYVKPLPETFDEKRRQAQLKRIIATEQGPIQGLCSHWDYEKKRWK